MAKSNGNTYRSSKGDFYGAVFGDAHLCPMHGSKIQTSAPGVDILHFLHKGPPTEVQTYKAFDDYLW